MSAAPDEIKGAEAEGTAYRHSFTPIDHLPVQSLRHE